MLKEVIRKPGEAIAYETRFVENSEVMPQLGNPPERLPEEFREKIRLFAQAHPASTTIPEKIGHVERFDYQTAVYEDGVTYNKYCNVYLPWCYDPSDKGKKYNVIYFQHGNTGDPEYLPVSPQKEMFDRLFYTEGVTPCIVVFTTYYFDVTKDVETRRTTGAVPAGDGGYPGVKPYFYKELLQDLIPALETRYNTYLADSSDAALKASRDHRLFSGYSRGCVFTWSMVHHAFEYFRYFVPMSCVCTAGHPIREAFPLEEMVEYLTAPMKAHPELPFFIYAFNGGKQDIPNMAEQIDALLQAPEIRFGTDQAAANFYYCESDFFHGDMFAPAYYYNALPKIWG